MTEPAVAPGISSNLLWLEQAYRVRFDEATPDGLARTSALVGYLADVAWRHSEVLGFPRPWYRERRLAWVVRAIDLDLVVPIHDGDEVHVSTRIAGFRRVMCRRRSEIRAADGTIAAYVSVDWAMTDGRAPLRIPVEFTAIPGVDLDPFAPTRVDLPVAPPGVLSRALEPRLRELDPMGHVNNAVYLDWMDEAIAIAGGVDDVRTAPRRYRLEYLRSAGPGEALRSVAWWEGGGWAWRLADDAGDLVRGRMDLPPDATASAGRDGAEIR